ncbi:hypothetical protein YYE_03155 [Plasmodium vinckei vinckei]|nr:hypothetical protein YYE_03155 [Plasmodium vinckei vinckei]
MNKRIFILVCIVLYALLAVSIHCSEQKYDQSKTYGLRSRIIRAIKKINRSNKKKNYNDDKDEFYYYKYIRDKKRKTEPCCCGLFYKETDEFYD